MSVWRRVVVFSNDFVWHGFLIYSRLQPGQYHAMTMPQSESEVQCPVFESDNDSIEVDHSYNNLHLAGRDYTLSRGIYCFVINKELSDFEKQFKLIIDHHLFCAFYKKGEISFLRLQSPVALIIVLYWKAIFINLRIKSLCFFHISIAALDLFLYYQSINYWF